MVCIISFGLIVLFQLNRAVLRRQILPIGIFRTLGLLAVLAFSISSLWEWLHAALSLLSGHNVLNFSNPRYLVTAACMPIIAFLCILRLYNWYRLHRTVAADDTSTTL
jgi:integral membrane protein